MIFKSQYAAEFIFFLTNLLDPIQDSLMSSMNSIEIANGDDA